MRTKKYHPRKNSCIVHSRSASCHFLGLAYLEERGRQNNVRARRNAFAAIHEVVLVQRSIHRKQSARHAVGAFPPQCRAMTASLPLLSLGQTVNSLWFACRLSTLLSEAPVNFLASVFFVTSALTCATSLQYLASYQETCANAGTSPTSFPSKL